jgi:hypothetical protein
VLVPVTTNDKHVLNFHHPDTTILGILPTELSSFAVSHDGTLLVKNAKEWIGVGMGVVEHSLNERFPQFTLESV